MNGLNYPLEQLMTIKKKRCEQALKVLEEKKSLLQEEQKKLLEVEKARDKVLYHKQEKLQQLRTSLDEGTTTDKIQQMKVYLEIVEEKLIAEEKKVETQKKAVEKAENQVELARQDLLTKQKELEKMEMHKKQWEEEVRFWSARQEGIEQDELGSAAHTVRKISEKKKK